MMLIALPFCALIACTGDEPTQVSADTAILDVEVVEETSASQSDADGIATGDGDDGDTGLSHDAEADLTEDVAEPDSMVDDADAEIVSLPCPGLCDDQDPCNGLEVCDSTTGTCVAGTPLECDDDDACTADSCDKGCMNEPIDCSDGDGCTVDSCDAETGCVSTVKDCDDGDPCTEDGCSPNGGCWNSEIVCEDEDACTEDTCGPEGCEFTPLDCGDGNPCTYDTCDSAVGCVYVDEDCDDDDPCTDDGCNPNGGCLSLAIECNDGDPCTVDTCITGLGCDFEPVTCPDDGDPCTTEACEASGACVSQSVVCEDASLCTTDACDPLTGACVFTPVACEDGDPCTTDSCDGGSGDCVSVDVNCDDQLLCTNDGCDSDTGLCVNEPVQCADGDLCNGQESCDPETGQCVPGQEVVCTDNNACDGLSLCDPATGGCVEGPPIDCTPEPDFDGCAGEMECDPFFGGCSLDPMSDLFCPMAPSQCDQTSGVVEPEDGEVVSFQPGYFTLRDDEQWAKREAIIDQIGAHSSVTPTSLESILISDLNRTATSINLPLIDCVNGGWTWNDGDQEVEYWWPQGVTGSVDGWGDIGAGENGLVAGTDVMMVSWYHKAEEDGSTSKYKGVRISIVDTWGKKYRHVILAEPVCDGVFSGGTCNGTADYEPLSSASASLHAGGIVWYKNYLYVADTSKGFRVFDLTRIQRVQTGEKNKLGYDASDGVYYGYNYRYVLPQVGAYTLCGASCCARFSWAGFDGTTDPPSIVAGEYVSSSKLGRAHRWDLDPSTGKLETAFKVSKPSGAYFPGVSNMQGGLSVNGHFFFSSSKSKNSFPPSAATLWDGAPGDSLEDHQWPKLPEDLYYDVFTDRLWTCTEEPATWLGNTRYCIHVDRSDVKNNYCD